MGKAFAPETPAPAMALRNPADGMPARVGSQPELSLKVRLPPLHVTVWLPLTQVLLRGVLCWAGVAPTVSSARQLLSPKQRRLQGQCHQETLWGSMAVCQHRHSVARLLQLTHFGCRRNLAALRCSSLTFQDQYIDSQLHLVTLAVN